MNTSTSPTPGNYLAAPLITALVFGLAATVFAFVLKEPEPVPVFILFGCIQCTAMVLFALLPLKAKRFARLSSLFLIGTALLALAGIMSRTNLQLEGFVMAALGGTMSGAIVHFMMAKIIGPLLYGRNWCGWGCWTAMILDSLPFTKANPWSTGGVRWIRWIHFVLALAVGSALFFVFKASATLTAGATQPGMGTMAELWWFVGGTVLYYLVGIGMALTMHDNRAFCKYVCPVSVLFKLTSRASLLRIGTTAAKCTNCKSCVAACPMGIDIPSYAAAGKRITSTECIGCMHCVAHCPSGALGASVGVDVAGRSRLISREQKRAA
jgi:polyferredoxin